jgi:hypothetical protein
MTRGVEVKVPSELCEVGDVRKGKKRGKLKLMGIYHEEPSKLKSNINLGLIGEFRSENVLYQGEDQSRPIFYKMPICALQIVNVNQKTLVSYFRNWEVGGFDEEFADFDLAARGLGGLELEDIQNLIAADAAKGTEVFEALGMKFPARQVTGWAWLSY